MSTSRDEIFARLRRASTPLTADTPRPEPLVPAVAQTTGAARLAQFKEKATALACTIANLGSAQEVPKEVARYLAEHALPSDIWCSTEAAITSLPWASQAELTLHTDIARDKLDGGTSVTGCLAAVAETGALTVASGVDFATRLAFLPDTHIIVCRLDQLVGGIEDVWASIRQYTKSGGVPPRAINFIAGPSRTGDIEATLVMGAHGPRAVHIILVPAST